MGGSMRAANACMGVGLCCNIVHGAAGRLCRPWLQLEAPAFHQLRLPAWSPQPCAAQQVALPPSTQILPHLPGHSTLVSMPCAYAGAMKPQLKLIDRDDVEWALRLFLSQLIVPYLYCCCCGKPSGGQDTCCLHLCASRHLNHERPLYTPPSARLCHPGDNLTPWLVTMRLPDT